MILIVRVKNNDCLMGLEMKNEGEKSRIPGNTGLGAASLKAPKDRLCP